MFFIQQCTKIVFLSCLLLVKQSESQNFYLRRDHTPHSQTFPWGKRPQGFPPPLLGKASWRFPTGKRVAKMIIFPAEAYVAGPPLSGLLTFKKGKVHIYSYCTFVWSSDRVLGCLMNYGWMDGWMEPPGKEEGSVKKRKKKNRPKE